MITRTPADSHLVRTVSRSNIFVVPRYNTAVRSVDAVWDFNAAIGDGRVRPSANHVSSSAIQKSGSSCVAIAMVSVNIMSPSIVNSMPASRNTFVIAVSDVASGAAGVGDASNVISEKVGMVGIDVTGMESPPNTSSPISKSVGIGKSSAAVSVVVPVVPDAAAMFNVLNVDVWGRPMPLRIRINAPCNSVGMLLGILYMSETGSGVVGFSGSGVGSGSGGGGGANARCTHSGIGNVNKGFLLRIITYVVAMYIGAAAKINMPNTNPPNPARRACIRRFH